MGDAEAAVVHSRGQARMPRDAAEQPLSAECEMATAGQRCGRDEFETYDWWRRWESNPRPMDSPRRLLRACPVV